MGLLLARSIINVLLSQYNAKEKVDPGNLFRVQIKEPPSSLVLGGTYSATTRAIARSSGAYLIDTRQRSKGGDTAEETEFLVVSSQKGGKGMMFPKGGWEIDETIEQAALRETREEAGVVCTLEARIDERDNLGKWMYKSKGSGSYHDGYTFSLHVSEQLNSWPERDLRNRRWATAAEAREVCPHGWMKEALDELVYRLTKQREGELGASPM